MYVSTSGLYLDIWLFSRFSLVMTRSITSSMVLAVACGGTGVAGGAEKAAAAKVLKTRMDKTDRRAAGTDLNIFFSPSGCHVEFNSHARRKIDGLIILLRRLEFNLLRRANSGLIQAMA